MFYWFGRGIWGLGFGFGVVGPPLLKKEMMEKKKNKGRWISRGLNYEKMSRVIGGFISLWLLPFTKIYFSLILVYYARPTPGLGMPCRPNTVRA